jgi:hypothetical protein
MKRTEPMNEPHRSGTQAGRRARADVRQALLKSGSAHLYPGIPAGEWQPATVMANLVFALGTGKGGPPQPRNRVLNGEHFEFRGRPSAGAQDDQRRSRLEERQDRQEGALDG